MKELIRKILREQEEEDFSPVIPIWGSKKRQNQIYQYLDKIIKREEGEDAIKFKDERYVGRWFAIKQTTEQNDQLDLLVTEKIFWDICDNAGKPVSLLNENGDCDVKFITETIREWIKDKYGIILTGKIYIL